MASSDYAERLDGLGQSVRSAIVGLLRKVRFEIIPLKNAVSQAIHLPKGSVVTVTASPNKGMEATMDLCAELAESGFDVTPHLSARLHKDRAHLRKMLDRAGELGLRKAFVVGGDHMHPGEFFDGLSLLRAMEEMGHPFEEVGIPAYPEGHPVIPDTKLEQALLEKQPYAHHLATQMCFDGNAIRSFLSSARQRNIGLPALLGIPGVGGRMKLLQISARIGVGDSMRFLSKNAKVVTKLLGPGGYDPGELLEDLGASLADPLLAIEGLHVYTFNRCEATEAWRQEYLEALTR
jgi:methylenetetrahydrofolate reductase (NADPH)